MAWPQTLESWNIWTETDAKGHLIQCPHFTNREMKISDSFLAFSLVSSFSYTSSRLFYWFPQNVRWSRGRSPVNWVDPLWSVYRRTWISQRKKDMEWLPPLSLEGMPTFVNSQACWKYQSAVTDILILCIIFISFTHIYLHRADNGRDRFIDTEKKRKLNMKSCM